MAPGAFMGYQNAGCYYYNLSFMAQPENCFFSDAVPSPWSWGIFPSTEIPKCSSLHIIIWYYVKIIMYLEFVSSPILHVFLIC